MGQAFVLQDPTQPLSPRCDCKVAKIPWSPPHHLSNGPKGQIQEGKEGEEDLGPVAPRSTAPFGVPHSRSPACSLFGQYVCSPALSSPASHKL